MKKTRAHDISMAVVEAAYEDVKENKGAAGVDDETIEDFERNREGNLYKIWNRMSSGSYFPPPVREVEIPKRDGKKRKLGIPTVSDRVAQTVTRRYLEPEVEPKFHDDSYGFRPGRGQEEAITVTRKRCWKYDWVIDLDIKGFFDNLDHTLVLNAVSQHTQLTWILLYIERWLKAPVQEKNGEVRERDKGTPQGGAISPLLANIYLHHAFDEWMKKQFPSVPFARFADDIVVHCNTLKQAQYVLKQIAARLALWKLELHPEKTRIVYCKDSNRRGNHPDVQFDFLGFTFRQRQARGRDGRKFGSFIPAMSDRARKEKKEIIREWQLQRRTDLSIKELASLCNAQLRGWCNYYGMFYPSKLKHLLVPINWKITKWVKKKYRKGTREALRWLKAVIEREPKLFAHWEFGVVLA